MAIYLFAEKINNGNSIDVFNYGDMQRDFTYIDDVINGTRASIEKIMIMKFLILATISQKIL